MLDKLQLSEVELVAITRRNLWLPRNKVIFEDNLEAPSTIVQRAHKALEEFIEARINAKKFTAAVGRRVKDVK